MYDSNWSVLRLDGIKALELTARAKEVRDFLVRRGIVVPPGNRLSRAIDLIERTNADLNEGRPFTVDEDERVRLAESWRTLWEAFIVCHAIYQGRPSARAITNDLLMAFVHGAEVPSADRNARPRSTQFEAFTAAHLVQGGASVIRDEPDLRMTFFDRDVGVAVKRVTSLKPTEVYDDLRDAANQLRDSCGCGFVAMSLDSWVEDLGSSRDPVVVGRRFNVQLKAAHEQLEGIATRRAVLGAFLTVSCMYWTERDGMPYLQWSVPQQVFAFSDDRYADEQFAALLDPLQARWRASLREAAELLV